MQLDPAVERGHALAEELHNIMLTSTADLDAKEQCAVMMSAADELAVALIAVFFERRGWPGCAATHARHVMEGLMAIEKVMDEEQTEEK